MKFSYNSKMRGTTTGNPHEIRVGSYKCGTYSQFGKEYCSSHYISERNIEKIVLNDIRSMIQLVEEDEENARKLAQKQDEHDVDEYISRLKRFRNAEYLTRQMYLELIDAVTVDEFERDKQGRDIHIYYKFIDKGYTGKPE